MVTMVTHDGGMCIGTPSHPGGTSFLLLLTLKAGRAEVAGTALIFAINAAPTPDTFTSAKICVNVNAFRVDQISEWRNGGGAWGMTTEDKLTK
jgi:hypothetical protein